MMGVVMSEFIAKLIRIEQVLDVNSRRVDLTFKHQQKHYKATFPLDTINEILRQVDVESPFDLLGKSALFYDMSDGSYTFENMVSNDD